MAPVASASRRWKMVISTRCLDGFHPRVSCADNSARMSRDYLSDTKRIPFVSGMRLSRVRRFQRGVLAASMTFFRARPLPFPEPPPALSTLNLPDTLKGCSF